MGNLTDEEYAKIAAVYADIYQRMLIDNLRLLSLFELIQKEDANDEDHQADAGASESQRAKAGGESANSE